MQPVRGIEGTRPPAGGKKEPSGLFFSAPGCGSQHPRVPWAARASCWPLPQQLLPASATGRGRRCCKSHPVGMSNVVAAAAFARGIFNLTRTGIAAELTAASEQRLPLVGGRCRIATKRGVQGSEAGAVVSGMRTPFQGVKHTLGTTTRDSTALRSRVSNQPSGLLLSASGCGSQHPRVPWAALASCWPLPQQLLPASATGRGRRCCKSHPVGMSTVVAAAAFARGIFNLTRTGIAAELTAASGGNRAAVRLHLEYHMPFYG